VRNSEKPEKPLELYRRRMNLIILILSMLFGKEIKLIVDGTILRVANIYRAQTRNIKKGCSVGAYKRRTSK
jgi:hypothetical protein